MTGPTAAKAEIAFSLSEPPILAVENQRHAMFQRQTRRPFPASYIFLLALAVLGLLFFLIKNLNQPAPQKSPPPTEQTGE